MQIGIVSLFPEMFPAVIRYGVTRRAVERGILRLNYWNPRDFARGSRRPVDDRPYGGGPGMVLMVQPLREAIRAAKAEIGADTAVLYLSPQGRRLDHAGAVELAARDRMILVCGRYEGVDERLITAEIDEEWSIGDYVLSGGELAAMVIIDALTRFIPGVLGHADSAREDSFAEGLLDCPHYTRPEELDGLRVPAVLLGGNHEQIRRWRLKQSLGRTWLRRPEMLFSADLDDERRVLLKEFVTEYVKDIAGQKHEQHHWTNRSGADDPPAPRFWAG